MENLPLEKKDSEMISVLVIVEDSAKGYRTAFRYPEEARVEASVQSESVRTLNELLKDANGKTLARLLRPKRQLMNNRPFRASVNNVMFIGHPMTLDPSDDPTRTVGFIAIQRLDWD